MQVLEQHDRRRCRRVDGMIAPSPAPVLRPGHQQRRQVGGRPADRCCRLRRAGAIASTCRARRAPAARCGRCDQARRRGRRASSPLRRRPRQAPPERRVRGAPCSSDRCAMRRGRTRPPRSRRAARRHGGQQDSCRKSKRERVHWPEAAVRSARHCDSWSAAARRPEPTSVVRRNRARPRQRA